MGYKTYYKVCPGCHGAGFKREVQGKDKWGNPNYETYPCFLCGGSGKIEDTTKYEPDPLTYPNPEPLDPSGGIVDPILPEPPIDENLSTLDKIIYGVCFVVCFIIGFNFITSARPDPNYIAAIIVGFITGIIGARFYKILFVIFVFYLIAKIFI